MSKPQPDLGRSHPSLLNRLPATGTDLDELDRLRNLGDDIDFVQRHIGLAPTPIDPAARAYQEWHGPRVRSACKWLHQLGYTDRLLRTTSAYTPTFEGAIQQFQQDAELKPDGWMGPRTWNALVTLVTFDAPADLAPYYEASSTVARPRPSVALKRATLLRLCVLEHADQLPHIGLDSASLDSAIRRGLVGFGQFLRALDGTSTTIRDRHQPEQQLFDHDAQLRILTQWKQRHTRGPWPQGYSPQVLGLARVEMWLQDHDVGALDTESTRHRKAQRLTYQALAEERRRRELPPRKKEQRLDLSLLNAWTREQAAPVTSLSSDHRDKLLAAVEQVGTDSPDELDETWRHVTNSRFGLWDGLRRAFRWLGSLVSRTVSAIAKALRGVAVGLVRLVRWLYQSASDALTAIHLAASSFVQVLTGPLHSGHGVTQVQPDFDLVTVITSPKASQQHSAYIDRVIRGFGLATRILKVIVQLFVTAATGGWTWLHLLRSLVSVASDLVEQGRALRLSTT